MTGSGRGIGLGCALELAKDGADVVINDVPGGPDLPGAAEQIRALGRSCTPVEADAFSRAECERLVSAALDAVGRIDILVSVPAWTRRHDFLEFDPDDFENTIRGTLTAGFHVSQLAAQHMAKRGGGGKIIFISSIHGTVPYPRSTAYNAAKAGLNHMMRTMAYELTPHHINVNGIEPGWIDTPGERLFLSEEEIQEAAPLMPWGRLGLPADIGKAAAFLASDDADYITAAVLRVDGGLYLNGVKEY